MDINTLVSLTNQKLAGETLLYMQLESYFDQVVDKINADLNACFPSFSAHRTNTGASQIYDYFPDQYLRSVVATGAAYHFYVVDEEGSQTAVQLQYEYRENLFIMLRDYADQIPEIYKAVNRGYLSDGSGNYINPEDLINPDIRYMQGPPGETGAPGQTPYIGTNGNWFIGIIDTGISARGPQGSTGFNPYISADGFWVTAAGKTNIKAEGTQGPQGLRGLQGIQGPKGDTGAKGSKGDIGETGPRGEQGVPGVWYGENPPPTDAYTVWINPNEFAGDPIVDGYVFRAGDEYFRPGAKIAVINGETFLYVDQSQGDYYISVYHDGTTPFIYDFTL